MSSLIIITIIFFGTLVFIYLLLDSRQKAFDETLRLTIKDLTFALKSKNVDEYARVAPEEALEEIEEPADELVDLESVEPDVLIKKIKEYENN